MNKNIKVLLMFTMFTSVHYASTMGGMSSDMINRIMQISSLITHGALEENSGRDPEKYIDSDGNFSIDFSNLSVCDLKNSSSLHHSDVFEKIRNNLLGMVGSRPIVMNFHHNYLTGAGIQALATFILNNAVLKNQLLRLDLSNNRFKSDALPHLKNLLDQCPQLQKLDISINYISSQDVAQADLRDSRVIFSTY